MKSAKKILTKVWDATPRQMVNYVRRWLYPTEIQRLQATPRYTPTVATFMGRKLHIPDAASYLGMMEEIFVRRHYEFIADTETPYIIDVGANIGLSIIFFKILYPKSRILAFEPDEKIFDCLQKNMKTFGFEEVLLLNKAAWKEDTVLEFWQEGSWSGRVAKDVDQGRKINVEAERLRKYLNEKVDMLKVDIEGAETEVLIDCADLLHNVKNAFIEYHHHFSERQTLHILLKLLSDAGFDYHIKESFVAKQPFLSRPHPMGMDFQVDIFAFRK